MGLVDYSSDSSESDETAGPPTKKQKASDTQTIKSSPAKSELPPLPSAFHDLYASTVRVSASDDPTLHQGRKRVNPHKVGNWPSHLYIEWHPTPTERAILTTLLSNLQSRLTSPSSAFTSPSTSPTITSFLTSDLGAPQPLHISLSRPIVLSTGQKDSFLSNLETTVRTSGIAPFTIAPTGLSWHRTAESARSFLVLRVGSRTAPALEKRPPDEGSGPENPQLRAPANPELGTLLHRANALVAAFGQPPLYAPTSALGASDDRDVSVDAEVDADADVDVDVDAAFHISIAWSFAAPSVELRRLTEDAFDSAYQGVRAPSSISSDDQKPARGGGETLGDGSPESALPTPATVKDVVSAMRIRVDGIKAKIGNVVTHVALPDARRRNDGGAGGRGLFGF